MSDGIFADLGLDVDFDNFPSATYSGYVTEAKVINYKDAAKGRAMVLTYKVADEGEHKGKTIDEFKSCNKFDDATKKKWLKIRLLSLGVPESRLSEVNPSDLVGTAVFFTTKKNGEYTNVSTVKVAEEDFPSNGEQPSVGVSGGSTDLSNLL
jgi:hypothetical protein